jgi:threonine dehydrogenase-like Zn-dependent dehydrogenase
MLVVDDGVVLVGGVVVGGGEVGGGPVVGVVVGLGEEVVGLGEGDPVVGEGDGRCTACDAGRVDGTNVPPPRPGAGE